MAACAVCQKTVRRARSGPTLCGARACQRTWLGTDLPAGVRARREEVERAAAALASTVNDVRRRSGLPALPLAVLPSNDRVIGPLPKAMRARFLAGLGVKSQRVMRGMSLRAQPSGETHVGAAVAEPNRVAPTEVAPPLAASPTVLSDAMIAGACATCRGDCCTGGTDHAHMDDASLGRLQREHGWRTADDVIAAYAARLPRVHYKGSCVFHGAGGCVLPRDMRADVCNRYVCSSLTQLARTLEENAESGVVAVAASPHAPRRVRVLFTDGTNPPSP